MIRRQLPVYSPLTLSGLFAGFGALVRRSDPLRRAVERLTRERYQCSGVLLTDSGTSALQLALSLATRDRGNLIAVPAYCCYDVATAAVGADARVVLYDVDPRTLGPDWDSLRAAVSRGATAVVVAHLYGIPVDLEAAGTIAADAQAVLIEDAAQGAGGTFVGQPLGAFGALAVLSFGRGKGMTAGSGGALLARDDDGARLLGGVGRLARPNSPLSGLAKLTAQWVAGRPSLYGVPASIPALGLGTTVYKEPSEPTELSGSACAVLARVWAAAEAENAVRRRNGERLARAVGAASHLSSLCVSSDAHPGYLRFPLLVPPALRPLANGRAAQRLGIIGGYPTPLSAVAALRSRCVNAEDGFEGAQALAEGLVTLPTHSLLAEAELQAIEAWVEGLSEPHVAVRV